MQVAIQLYTVRSETERDMSGTLERLADIGYRAVEFAGCGNSEPAAIRDVLDRIGIEGVAAHVALARIEHEFDIVVDEMHILGCRYLIVPWLAPELRNQAGYDHLIELLNRRAPDARDAGLQLGYHNHDFEFRGDDGFLPFDRIAESTDPNLVCLELDIGWIAYAGHDPVALIERYRDRVPLLHAKEEQIDGSDDLPAPGSGPLPWQQIVDGGKIAGTRYLIAEDDNPRDPLRTAHAAFDNLTNLVHS